MLSLSQKTKKSYRSITEIMTQQKMLQSYQQILADGKRGLDIVMNEIGKRFVESIFYLERELISGPEYSPKEKGLYKWAKQGGSVYIGNHKVKVDKPRLRSSKGEIKLDSYETLKNPEIFSQELLGKVLGGLSERRYKETLVTTAETFGVSAGSVSNRIIEATTAQMKEFKERSLNDIDLFAMFIDGINFGKSTFIVSLGIDREGNKHILGFWEGATENRHVCQELFEDLERRGLYMHHGVIYVTDGGKGIIKALKDMFGKDLIHQRCTIHKEHNIICHLQKQYHKKAKMMYRDALNCVKYWDAKAALNKMETWLNEINVSAADSLAECKEELLTLHRLEVPASLRLTLHTTNPIESSFSVVKEGSHKIKRHRGSLMSQRWLASILLYAEKHFRRVKGYAEIDVLMNKTQEGLMSIPIPELKVA